MHLDKSGFKYVLSTWKSMGLSTYYSKLRTDFSKLSTYFAKLSMDFAMLSTDIS